MRHARSSFAGDTIDGSLQRVKWPVAPGLCRSACLGFEAGGMGVRGGTWTLEHAVQK